MPVLASIGSVLGDVAGPLASALLVVLVVSRVDLARTQNKRSRTLRLRLRRALGVGPGGQPIDWLFMNEVQYDEIAEELLDLSDQAFDVDPGAGVALRDAAQRVNDLGRLALGAKASLEQFDKRYDDGERSEGFPLPY